MSGKRNALFGLLIALAVMVVGALSPQGALAATLYISEFSTGVTNSPGSDQVQTPPQAALTDQAIALSGASAASAAFNSKTHAVMLVCDEGCSIKFGSSSVSATTSNYLLQQGVPYMFGVAPGQFIAAIANSAGNTGGGSGGPSANVNVAQWGGAATSLGQKVMASSVPVVVASDQSSLPVTPAATESHLGEVGGNQITVQVAQTVTASSAYATGNAIGGLMTIANVARVSSTSGAPGTSGLLQSVVMNIKSAQTTPVDIIIFNSNPTGTTCTDKTAIAIAAADFDKVLGIAHMTDFTSGGTPSDGQSQNLAMPYALTSSTTLYACAVTRSTPTYASTSDVSFGFRFLRN